MVGVEMEVAARIILDQGKDIKELTRIELMTLLKSHKILKPGEGKVEERREKWRKIFKPSHKVWTAQDKSALAKLEDEHVLIKETALGCLKEQHKQELLATFRAMPPEEKESFLMEMNTNVEKGGKYI